jgi:hypothetical protein
MFSKKRLALSFLAFAVMALVTSTVPTHLAKALAPPVLADGTAPPAPPIPWGKFVGA